MRRQSLMVGALLVVLIVEVWYLYGRGDGLMVVTEEG